MRSNMIRVSIFLYMVTASIILPQMPAMPDGAITNWLVDDPEEIASYLVFETELVKDKLPSSIRFLTIEELANNQIPWASKHLIEYPEHARWGISFIEIVRMKTFEIDGVEPDWPKHGAVALWFARVTTTDLADAHFKANPYLALEFWIPDSEYVTYMRKKGYSASYGDVTLMKNSKGKWNGTISVDDLNIVCDCIPMKYPKQNGSSGSQVFFPPANSGLSSIIQVAMTGHQVLQCSDESSWKFDGDHPLTKGYLVGPTTFQFGYKLVGGTYDYTINPLE